MCWSLALELLACQLPMPCSMLVSPSAAVADALLLLLACQLPMPFCCCVVPGCVSTCALLGAGERFCCAVAPLVVLLTLCCGQASTTR